MINIIAAVADNNIIGNQNQLPFTLKEDMARFKSLTIGNIVVMGKNTYNSISHPLKDRTNIIISSTMHDIEGAIVVPNFDIAIQKAKEIAKKENNQIFICGGQCVYQSAIHTADTLYITHVHQKPEGDAYFPKIPDDFVKVESTHLIDTGTDTDFCIYKRQ